MRRRIWELDALRGLLILCMVAIHLTYDLVDLYRVVTLENPFWYRLGTAWGGVPFVVISGICASFGSRPVRRGATVFACGMLCTLVTALMYLLRFTGKGIVIYFGILHCLGVCMMLWPLLKKVPAPVQAVLGIGIIALGLYTRDHLRVDFPWLVPLGIPNWGFSSSDYFPLLPNLGYFLVGAALGKRLYPARQTLFPRVNDRNPILRFFTFCGRHSLLIYLIHQPVLAGLLALIL